MSSAHIAGGGGSGSASPTTTKGDIIARTSTADDRVAVGTNGFVLTADSGSATGVAWAAAPGAGGGAATTTAFVTIGNDAALSAERALSDDGATVQHTDGGAGTTVTTSVRDNGISNAKLRDSSALTVIGRSANSSGDPADIAAVAASGAVLRESGSTIGFGTIATAGITDAAVTLAKMANLAQDQFIGRVTASTGVPETTTITAAARTVLDDTTVSAMVDTLGGAAATGTGGLVRTANQTLTGNTNTTTLITTALRVTNSTTGQTAFAGGGQASATLCTAGLNNFTTVATAGDSCRLNTSNTGSFILVNNLGANTLALFPPSGSSINGLASNASVSIPAGYGVIAFCSSATTWEVVGNIVKTSAQFANMVSDETGSGALVFATSPTLVTPALGAATATSLALTTDLAVVDGGTGASDAATARTNLGAAPTASPVFTGNVSVTIPSTVTTGGTTATIDWANGVGQNFDAQGSSGNITFTFSNPASGASYVLLLQQGSTARTYTWPAAVKWLGGSAPTVSTTDNDIDMVTFFYNGTNYIGSHGGKYTP